MNQTLARLIEEGHQLLQAQQLEAAASKYQQVYVLAPTHVEAMYNLGCICAHQHQFEDALRWADKVLKVNDDHQPSLELQASCLMEMERFAAALDILESIEETNDSALMLANMGVCHFKLSEWEQAEEYLREALEGDVLYQSRFELVESILYHPFYAELHHYLAQTLQQQKHAKEARLHYYLAKCLNPELTLNSTHEQVVSKAHLDIHPYFDFPEFNSPPQANDDPQVIFSYLLQAPVEEILDMRSMFQSATHQQFLDEAIATSQTQGELGFTARLQGLSDIVFEKDDGQLLSMINSDPWQHWFTLADQVHQGHITLDEAVSRHLTFDWQSSKALLKLARRFLNQDPESAQMLISFIERSMATHEQSLPVAYALAIALAAELEQRLGQAKRSLLRYEKALDLIAETDHHEDEVNILFAMGGALYRLQRFGDLLRTLDQIMTIASASHLPKAHVQACYHRAAIHYEMSAFKACQRDCETAIHLMAESQEGHEMQQQLAPLYQEACRELNEFPNSVIMGLIDEELHFPPEPEDALFDPMMDDVSVYTRTETNANAIENKDDQLTKAPFDNMSANDSVNASIEHQTFSTPDVNALSANDETFTHGKKSVGQAFNEEALNEKALANDQNINPSFHQNPKQNSASNLQKNKIKGGAPAELTTDRVIDLESTSSGQSSLSYTPSDKKIRKDAQDTHDILQRLWQRGIDLVSSEHYEDGLYHLLRAQAQLEASPYRQDTISRGKQVLLMNDIAKALYHLERYDEALQRVERGLYISDQEPLDIDLWPILCNASLIAIHLKQTKTAIHHMERALELAQMHNEPKREMTSLKLLAELLIDFAPEQAAELAEYREQKSRFNESFLSSDYSDWDSTTDISDTIEYEYPLFPTPNPVQTLTQENHRGLTTWQTGVDALVHGEYLTAIHSFQQVSLDEGYNNQQIALAQMNIGVAYCELGQYSETLSHWKHAQNILHTLGDFIRCFALRCRMLQVSHQLKTHISGYLRPTQDFDIDTQIQTLKRDWFDIEPLKIRRNVGLQFADTLIALAKYSLAEDILLTIIQEVNNQHRDKTEEEKTANYLQSNLSPHLGPDYQSCDDAMMAYGMLGKIMSHDQRYSEAIECYLCALDGADQLGNMAMVQTINAWLAFTLHQANQLSEAAYYYQQSLEGAEESQDLMQKANLHQHFSSLLFQQGLYHQAVQHAEEAIKISDDMEQTSLIAQRSLVSLITFLPGDALNDATLDRAIHTLDTGLNSQDSLIQSVSRAHHATHFLAKGDRSTALKLLDDVAKMDSTGVRDRFGYSTTLLTNARMIQELSPDRAIAYAFIARDIAMDLSHSEQLVDCDELLLSLALTIKNESLIEEHIEYLLPQLETYQRQIRSLSQQKTLYQRFYPLIERCICYYVSQTNTQRVIELNNWKSFLQF